MFLIAEAYAGVALSEEARWPGKRAAPGTPRSACGSCSSYRASPAGCAGLGTGQGRSPSSRWGPRHVAALEPLGGPLTVGALATRLGLTLSTVSGVLADLDSTGFVAGQTDAGEQPRGPLQRALARLNELREPLSLGVHSPRPARCVYSYDYLATVNGLSPPCTKCPGQISARGRRPRSPGARGCRAGTGRCGRRASHS